MLSIEVHVMSSDFPSRLFYSGSVVAMPPPQEHALPLPSHSVVCMKERWGRGGGGVGKGYGKIMLYI